ncbi:MAG: type II toxin-antitoxin system PemK/MazF family toxin [Chloroflexota bacterium]
MVALQRGQIWWADLGEPLDSQPGYRRPVLVVQEDHFNQSRLSTVIILSLTSNLRYQELPGNIFLSRHDSGLSKDSVINITQISSIDKAWLDEYVSEISWTVMSQVDDSLRLVLGL